MRAETRIPTHKASLYIKVLCHYFGRTSPAEFNERRGDIQFTLGNCELLARPQELVLRVQADDTQQFENLKEIVGMRMENFVHREDMLIVEWDNIL